MKKKNTRENKRLLKEARKYGRRDGKNQVPRQDWGQASVPYLIKLQRDFAARGHELDLHLEQIRLEKEMKKVQAVKDEIQEKGKNNALDANLLRAEEELLRVRGILEGGDEEVPMAKFARMRMITNLFYKPFLFFLFVGEVMITAPAFQVLLGERKTTAWIITYSVGFLSVGAAHILGIYLKSQFDRSRPKSKLYNVIFAVVACFITSTITFLSYIRGSNSALSAGMLTEIAPEWRLEFLWAFYTVLQLTFVVVGIAISFMHYSEIENAVQRAQLKVWLLRQKKDRRLAQKIKSGTSTEETKVDESDLFDRQSDVVASKKALLKAHYDSIAAAYRDANISSRKDEMNGAHPALQGSELDFRASGIEFATKDFAGVR